jgi:hypothetical protein
MALALIYITIGVFWAFMEHLMLGYDFEDIDNGTDAAIVISQQVIHYSRVILTWPLYIAEDVLIFLDNMRHSDDIE